MGVNKMRIKNIKIVSALLVVFLIGALLGGCASNDTSSTSEPNSSSSDSSNSSSDNSSNGNDASLNPNQITIGGATTTGAFYPIAGVMAKILSDNMPDHNFTAEATGGSVENARLMHGKESLIGFFGADTSFNAYQGTDKFDEPIDILGLASIYTNPFHVVVLADSGIETIQDLKGKKIAVGAPGSGTESKSKTILEYFGLTYDDITPEYLNFREGADGLLDKNIDAVMISVGLPSGNVVELGTSHEIRILEFPKEEGDKFVQKYPYFNTPIIPAGTYPGIDVDIQTLGAPNEIGVHKDLDEELVYQMAKILFEDKMEEFKQSHNAMSVINLDMLWQTGIPLHPGAERFYKEKGLIE